MSDFLISAQNQGYSNLGGGFKDFYSIWGINHFGSYVSKGLKQPTTTIDLFSLGKCKRLLFCLFKVMFLLFTFYHGKSLKAPLIWGICFFPTAVGKLYDPK